jgi:serine/threonine protein kinase
MSIPQRIGPYRVAHERPLGVGGMGQVLLVEKGDPPFVTRFALKLVRAVGDDDQAKRLFLAETQVLSGLAHRNVVRAIDFGEHDGTCYLVMEYVEGVSLQALLRARRLPTSLVVHIAIELCRGLVYCHDFARNRHLAEIVHRDIKPGNILLAVADGSVKLVDFGIAKFAGRDDQTATDNIRGTPAYMSPEHIDASKTLDQRSDLFSLGIVLYEMLTGQNPYREEDSEQAKSNDARVIGKILLNQPIKPLAELAPYLDPELIALVHSLLAHNKEDRPRSAQAVLAVLSRLPLRADANEMLIEYIQAARSERPTQRASATARPPTTTVAGKSKAPPSLAASSTSMSAPPGFAKPDLMPRMLTDEEEDLLEESSHFAPPTSLVSDEQDSLMSAQRPAPMLDRLRTPSWAPSARRSRRARYVGIATATALVIGAVAALTLNTRGTPSPAQPADAPLLARSEEKPPLREVEPATPPPELPATPSVWVPDAPQDAAVPTQEAASPAQTVTDPSDPVGANRARPEANKLADLRVVVYEWGWIWVDDVLKGESPVALTGLKPGMHTVGYGQNQDAPTQSKRVRLHPGPNKFSYDLR